MRVAAIYDVQGNLPALEAVLDDIRRAAVDRVVGGGDVVPGPIPRETIATLMDLEVPVHFIHGNGETEGLSVLAGGGPSPTVPEELHAVVRWVAEELLPEQGRVLAEWPLTHHLELPEPIGCSSLQASSFVTLRTTSSPRQVGSGQRVTPGHSISRRTTSSISRTRPRWSACSRTPRCDRPATISTRPFNTGLKRPRETKAVGQKREGRAGRLHSRWAAFRINPRELQPHPTDFLRRSRALPGRSSPRSRAHCSTIRGE